MGDQVPGCHRSNAHSSVRVHRKALYRYTGLLFEEEKVQERGVGEGVDVGD